MINRKTWIMVGVFAALLTLTIVLQRRGGEADPALELPTQAVRPLVFNLEMTDITGLRIENLDGQAVAAEKSGDVWVLTQPAAEAELVDQTRIAAVLAQLAAMQFLTESRINAPDSALQLEFAPYRLTLTTLSGEAIALKIGKAAPTGTGYYVAFDDRVPRIAAKNPLDQAINLLENPPLLPMPDPAEELPSP